MARVNATQFLRMLDRAMERRAPGPASADPSDRLRIPTYPSEPVDPGNWKDTVLEVTDPVVLRGRKFGGPVLLSGVVFHGLVDMRSAIVEGDADLTRCVFDEELWLDDVEIQGSLTLVRISAGKISMNGMVVRGRLDMSDTRADKPIRMFNADVEGYVDLRGLSVDSKGDTETSEIGLAGSRIRGDLRIGCSADNGNASHLKELDASGCRIGGNVNVVGSGFGPRFEKPPSWSKSPDASAVVWPAAERNESEQPWGPKLKFAGARISGAFRVVPFSGQSARHQWQITEIQPEGAPAYPVVGALDLHGAHIDADVTLAGALIQGPLNARNAHIGSGLRLCGAEIGQFAKAEGRWTWTLRHTALRGDFILDDADIEGGIRLEGAQISGAMELSRARLNGVVDVSAFSRMRDSAREFGFLVPSRIERNLKLVGARIEGDLQLLGAQIEGDLDLSSATLSGHMNVYGLDNTSVPEAPDFVPCRIGGDLCLYLATLSGVVQMGATRIGGSLRMWGAQSRSYIRLEPQGPIPCAIAGDIDAHSARMLQLELYGVSVGGRLRLTGCEMLHVKVLPGLLKAPRAGSNPSAGPHNAIRLSRVGIVEMDNATIKGDVALEYLQVMGREQMSGKADRGLLIRDSTIGGSVKLSGADAIVGLFSDSERPNENGALVAIRRSYAEALDACEIEPHAFGAAVIGNLEIKRCTIGAATHLSGVKVEGVIDLEDSSFGGDLNIRPLLPLKPATGPLTNRAREANRACCKALNLRMAKCANDVDLTGLTVETSERPAQGSHGSDLQHGSIGAQFLSVTGDLIAFKKQQIGGDAADSAQVAGLLDLSYAKLSHLQVAGSMFRDAPVGKSPKECGIGLMLERAVVGKLEVKERPNDGARQRVGDEAYPCPITLTDVAVEVWDIEGTPERKNQGVERYINLLKNDKDFRRSTYQSLERSLRNAGDDGEANALYIAMKQTSWEVRSSSAPGAMRRLEHVVEMLFRGLLAYGTNATPLLILVLVMAAFAMPAHLSRSNFEPSLEALATPKDRAGDEQLTSRGESPDASQWTIADALEVALKTHVPIVPIHARDDWQPRSEGRTAYSWDGNGKCNEKEEARNVGICLPVAPEDLFNIFQLLNWICWPILLTFLIRRLLRQ